MKELRYNFRLECEHCGRHCALYDYGPMSHRLCKTCILNMEEEEWE